MPVTDQSKLRIIIFYWLPPIVYCLAIFIQSSFPGSEHMPDVRFFDKLLHFMAYALLGILFYRACDTLLLKDKHKLLIFISIASATLYGISDEIHQYFVPSRYAEMAAAFAGYISITGGKPGKNPCRPAVPETESTAAGAPMITKRA